MKELVVATKNQHKLREIKEILSGYPLTIKSLHDFEYEIPEVIEDGKTFSENASKKAIQIAQHTGFVAMADDSGLCVDILNGAPGIYSARYAGCGKNDNDNIRKILNELSGFPLDKRSAHFHCAIALAHPREGIIGIVEEQCQGLIAFEERGVNGFGYDPIFLSPEYNKTFAEITAEEKNKISHRAKALKKFKSLVSEYINST